MLAVRRSTRHETRPERRACWWSISP